ncbi:hypothetical protein [Janthinobacterium lividum]|uniref:hypothetical protein n=1 Tax=Janthinobacterium lividum TaxID=29581 RepID=UPI001674A0B5|nr:hypothetical protein [Janthinobacterium lividum]
MAPVFKYRILKFFVDKESVNVGIYYECRAQKYTAPQLAPIHQVGIGIKPRQGRGSRVLRRSAILAVVVRPETRRVAILIMGADGGAASHGDAVAHFPGSGGRRLFLHLFFSQFEREQFGLILHCTILL